MALDYYLRKIAELSPKAAKIALRMVDGDPLVPVEWIVMLRPALVERSSESTSFGSTDWMTIASIERPAIQKITERFESREQRHARLWVQSLRKASLRLQADEDAPTASSS